MVGIARAEVDDRITQELGAETVKQVLASLWAGDCQSCGRPLGARPPALVVEDFGTDHKAMLFHPRCRASQWKDTGGIYLASGNLLSWTSHIVGMPIQVPGENGTRILPTLLVNPGLEMISLVRSDSGQWAVSIETVFGPLGLKPPGINGPGLGEPTPGLVAHLEGSELTVSAAAGLLTYSIGLQPADRPIRDAITGEGGVMLAVTHALDPSTVNNPAQLSPVLAGDRSLFGWAALDSARRGRSFYRSTSN